MFLHLCRQQLTPFNHVHIKMDSLKMDSKGVWLRDCPWLKKVPDLIQWSMTNQDVVAGEICVYVRMWETRAITFGLNSFQSIPLCFRHPYLIWSVSTSSNIFDIFTNVWITLIDLKTFISAIISSIHVMTPSQQHRLILSSAVKSKHIGHLHFLKIIKHVI